MDDDAGILDLTPNVCQVGGALTRRQAAAAPPPPEGEPQVVAEPVIAPAKPTNVEPVSTTTSITSEAGSPVSCPVCNKVYTNMRNFNSHFHLKHELKECPQCGIEFENSKELAIHLKTCKKAGLPLLK